MAEKNIGEQMANYYAKFANIFDSAEDEESKSYAEVFRIYAQNASQKKFYDRVNVNGQEFESVFKNTAVWADQMQGELEQAGAQGPLQNERDELRKFLSHMEDGQGAQEDGAAEGALPAEKEVGVNPEENLAREQLEKAFEGQESNQEIKPFDLEVPVKPGAVEINPAQATEVQPEAEAQPAEVKVQPEPEAEVRPEAEVPPEEKPEIPEVSAELPAEPEVSQQPEDLSEEEKQQEWGRAEVNRLARALKAKIEQEKVQLKKVRALAEKGSLGKRDKKLLEKTRDQLSTAA